MKLHSTLVEQLIKLFEINSGWPEQRKLREVLSELNVSTYKRANGSEVLVETKFLNEKLKEISR